MAQRASTRRSVIDGGDAYIGPWSPEEVKELTAIVRSMRAKQGGTVAGISWADVAARMGHKRNGQQCRNKWYDLHCPLDNRAAQR